MTLPELATGTATLAIESTRTKSLFGQGLVTSPSNNSMIIEFRVENVDEEFDRIKDLINNIAQPPTTMPWGNRSLLFRDSDGNLINFFTPVTADAIKKIS